MHHLGQKQTQLPTKLGVEAEDEVEESCDVKEDRRTGNSILDSDGEKSLEGILSVRGTCLVEKRGNHTTASAGEKPESSFGEDQRPSITRGR